MFLAVDTSITIRAAPEVIWDYACNPKNWTASNPTEHFGLRYDSPDNLPHTGVTFTQKESVAGIRAVLQGRVHYMERPHLVFWTGIAAYRLFGGLLTIRLPEGGVLNMAESKDGVQLAHNVHINFPDSLRGRFYLWFFQSRLKGRQAVYDHAFRELLYFKEKLENPASTDVQ